MPSILIIDRDRDFLFSFRDDPLTKRYTLLTADSGKTGQYLLSENQENLASVFVGHDVAKYIAGPDTYSIVRHARSTRATLPVFVFWEEDEKTFPEALRRLGISGVVNKKVTFKEIVRLSGLTTYFFDKDQVLSSTPSSAIQESLDRDEDFFAIRASDFVSGSTAVFDVYVRIRQGKFIKILKAGDAFSADRINNYLLRGVVHFYLRNDSRESYLAYCETISQTALKIEAISMKAKTSQVLNYGEETVKYMAETGVSSENLQYAANYVKGVQKVIKLLAKEDHRITRFLDQLANHDHAAGVTLVAGLLAKELDLESDHATQIVGVASLLHDIGLEEMPARFQDENVDDMSDAELAIFYKHGEIGSKILADCRGMHPSVVQAVLQHHERKTEVRGLTRTSRKAINRVSEIIGISDEYVNIVRHTAIQGKAHESVASGMMRGKLPGFTSAVSSAFSQIFL